MAVEPPAETAEVAAEEPAAAEAGPSAEAGAGGAAGVVATPTGEAGAEKPKKEVAAATVAAPKPRKLSDDDVAAWAEKDGGFSSLVVAGRESPLAALPALLATLRGGAPFVLYHPSAAPLADCLHLCQTKRLAVQLQLLETFTRAYQVAPNRTHPHMNTYPATGYVLAGIKIAK